MQQTPVATRKQQRWQLIAFFFLSGILTATWSSRIPEIQSGLGLSDAALGTVLSFLPIGLITGLLFGGWLLATVGARAILLGGCILCAVTLSLTSAVTTPFLLGLALFFFGLGRTVFNLAANTGAVELQRLYERPIISTFHGIWSLACFAAAGLTTLMIVQNVNPVYHFTAVAATVIVLAFLLIGKNKNAAAATDKRPFFVAPDRYLFLLGLMALCSMLCEGAVFDWSVNYFDNVIGAKKSLRTAGYLSFVISMSVGRLVGDRLIHWLGMHRLLVVNGTLMAAGFVLAASVPNVTAAALGFLLIGAGSSVLVPVIYMLAAKSKRLSPGYALSSVALIGSSGFLIGPLLIGNVSKYFGMQSAFYILSGFALVIFFLSLQVKKFS